MHEQDPRQVEVTSEEAAARPDAPSSTGDEVLSILADIEQQMGRLKSVRSSHEEQLQAVEQRARALAEREQQAEAAREKLHIDQQAVEEHRHALETREASLNEQTEAFDQRRLEFEHTAQQQREELQSARRHLEEERSVLAEREDELAAHRRGLEEARAELDRERREHAQLQSRIGQLEQELQQARQEVDQAVRAKQAESEQQQAGLQQQLQASQHRADETSARCDQLAAEMGDLRAKLEERDRQLAAAHQQVEAGRRERSSSEQMNERVRSAEHEATELRRRAEQAEANVGELVEKLERTNREFERGQQQVEAAAAVEKKLREELQEARRQSEQRPAGPDPEALRRKDAKINELAGKLADLESVNRELRDQLSPLQQGTSESASLRKRVHELERQLAEARSEGDPETINRLRSKARQVAAVAEHLRRRHERLRKMRTLVRERGAGGGEARQAALEEHAQAMQRLDQEKMQLTEVRTMLARSEKKMIRRWARSRAVVLLGWLAVITAITAGASWLATDVIFPREISAVVTLQAQTRPGAELSDETLESWHDWHAAMLEDESFHKTLAKRMADRHLDEYGTASAIGRRLVDDLRIDESMRGEITLTLAGRHPEPTALFLDTLALTLASESGRQMNKRPDTARAAVLGERKESGRLRYAALNAAPIDQQHLLHAGMVFGAAMTAVLIVLTFLYKRLAEVRREFEEDVLVVDEHPSL